MLGCVRVRESVWGQEATLVGDAHVSSAQPAVNSGTLSNLNVGGGYTALVQFDLGMLPAGTTAAQISKATLRVYCNRADVPGAVQAQLVGGAWTELGVTYATLPALGAVVQTAQVAGAGEFVTFDVTSAVQGWVGAPGTNYGLALVAPGRERWCSSIARRMIRRRMLRSWRLRWRGAGTVGPGHRGQRGRRGFRGRRGRPGATGASGASGADGAAGSAGDFGDGRGDCVPGDV